jgi:Protein of unknown function (DUF1194)
MKIVLMATAFLLLAAHGAPAQTEVDVALVLAGDVSGSMAHDLGAQRDGFVAAFRSPAIVEAIHAGELGRIAVTYVEWAGPQQRWVVVPWTFVDDRASADAFADHLAAQPPVKGYRTSISSGLLFAFQLLQNSDVAALRRTIDVSGDGPNNAGPPVGAVRDFIVARDITINGLPVAGRGRDEGEFAYMFEPAETDLDAYFDACVVGGPGAFTMPMTAATGYAAAIRRKLVLEIAGLPPRIILAAFATPADRRRDCPP